MKTNYSLSEYCDWMRTNRSSDQTIGHYASRIKAILRALDCPSDALGDLKAWTTDSARLNAYLGKLNPASKQNTASAWRSFAGWLETVGVKAAEIADGRYGERMVELPAVRTVLPSEVQSAIGELCAMLKKKTELRLPQIASCLWRQLEVSAYPTATSDIDPRVLRWGPVAYRLGKEYVPALMVIWDWSRGDVEYPDPMQPLVPGERGGAMPLDLNTLHALTKLYEQEKMPAVCPRWYHGTGTGTDADHDAWKATEESNRIRAEFEAADGLKPMASTATIPGRRPPPPPPAPGVAVIPSPSLPPRVAMAELPNLPPMPPPR